MVVVIAIVLLAQCSIAPFLHEAIADYSGNHCLSYNGVNDYVVFGNSPVFHSAALTLEAWIKPKYDIIYGSNSQYGHQSGVVATTRPQGMSTDTGWQVWFSYSNGYLGFAFWYAPAVGVSYQSIKQVWYNDSWYHIAVTYDPTLPNGNIKFFVNGTLDSELNENHTISYSTAGPFEAGLLPGGPDGGHPFGGLIDEVRVWNISRPQADIQSDWNRTLISTEMANPNLIGYWRFDEGSGPTSHDYSIYQNDAALAPAPSNPQWFSPGAPIVLASHDVAVTNVVSSKTGCLPMPTVGQGFSVTINVTVANQGSYTETFNTTAYANANITGSENVTLPAGGSTTVTFTWNTTGFAFGNYTISAYAWPVPGETNTANNNLTGGTVEVTIPGDLNGDGTVNILDAILLANAFGATPGSSTWNPNADINGDGVVNILDAIILAGHFQQHYP
jgi:hypothetical protein